LEKEPKPAALYCRTGRRAARLFALAEAARFNGPDADAIAQMVRNAGFAADDLAPEIANRISRRQPTSQNTN
jgi:protein tyrosine phosphatase (PTP) superfamily phosphohydrolase (DUF442 family)